MGVDQETGPVLVSEMPTASGLIGEELSLKLWMRDRNGSNVSSDFRNERAVVIITRPNGSSQRMVIQDNGKLSDVQAGDDVLDVSFISRHKGQYDVQVYWEAIPNNGSTKVSRTSLVTYFVAENYIDVKSKSISATRAVVVGEIVEPNRFGLPVKLKSKLPLQSTVETYAEVWGHDRNNTLKPIGWIGGVVTVADGILPFSFHNGWLEQEDFQEPFVLRNIKISGGENINLVVPHGDIQINGLVKEQIAPATSTSIEVNYAGLANEVSGYVVSDEMLFGVDPLELAPSAKSSGKMRKTTPGIGAAAWRRRNPVLFLHGYCDGGGVWNNTDVRRRFSSDGLVYYGTTGGTDVRTYTNQVRAFLIRERNAGRIDRIRGVVAHSQGGMAAAELLQNHRWLFTPTNKVYSPRRQIVSVGSPYNGVSGLEDGSRVGGKLREFALKVALCNEPPSDLYPAQNWKRNISSYTRSRIQAVYTDGGERDKSWHLASSTWCANRLNNGFLSSFLNGNDDGLLRNVDAINFAGQDSYIAKKCHTPPLTKSGWQVQYADTGALGNWAAAQFNNFRPYCQSTYDPNSDGWGWENGRSCVVPSYTVNYCTSQWSDPDGDGYGWENGRSCVVR